MFNGKQSFEINPSSTLHGDGTATHTAYAFSAIHSDNNRSPGPNVIRFPLPTRRNSIPSAFCNKHPSDSRNVDPSALPRA